MLLKKVAVVAVLAISTVSSSAALACNESEGCSAINARIRARQLDAQEERAQQRAQASVDAFRAGIFEANAKPVEALATAYEATATEYFALRGRYFQRIRYNLPTDLEPLIKEANELDDEMMSAYSVIDEIIQISRDYIARGRASASDQNSFLDYRKGAFLALQGGLDGLSRNLVRFEQLVKGVEKDEKAQENRRR